LLTVYNAYSAWKRAKDTPGAHEHAFCQKNFLNPQTLSNIEDIKNQLLVSTVDAGLLKLDPAELASLNRYLFDDMRIFGAFSDLTCIRARFTGRQRHFFTVPERIDINSGSDIIVNAVIAWSFYPKLLAREGKGWRNVANNQIVSLSPASVNKHSDSPSRWLSFYHILQGSSKLFHAHETSVVEDIAVAFLCGDQDFKVRGYRWLVPCRETATDVLLTLTSSFRVFSQSTGNASGSQ
jgi:ATP-dependent RNA helicase DHX29